MYCSVVVSETTFRGKTLSSLAALVLVTATKRHASILPDTYSTTHVMRSVRHHRQQPLTCLRLIMTLTSVLQ